MYMVCFEIFLAAMGTFVEQRGLRLRNLPVEVGKVANFYSKNKYLLQ